MTQPAERAVQTLTREMRAKLRVAAVHGPGRGESWPKTGWEKLSIRECFARALGEMAELSLAIASGSPEQVREEVADVANYLAFLVANIEPTAPAQAQQETGS